jgi:hypothetical protein
VRAEMCAWRVEAHARIAIRIIDAVGPCLHYARRAFAPPRVARSDGDRSRILVGRE